MEKIEVNEVKEGGKKTVLPIIIGEGKGKRERKKIVLLIIILVKSGNPFRLYRRKIYSK